MVERRRAKTKSLLVLAKPRELRLSFFSSVGGSQTKIAKDRKATTPFPLRSTEIFFEAADGLHGKSCRNSQSDHFIISATVPLFDLQEPGLYPKIRGLGILRSGGTTKGCKGGTQETCRANHPQTNIEARLKGVEPRKKKHNY